MVFRTNSSYARRDICFLCPSSLAASDVVGKAPRAMNIKGPKMPNICWIQVKPSASHRWWEARTTWGQVFNVSRNLVRQVGMPPRVKCMLYWGGTHGIQREVHFWVLCVIAS